MSSIVLNMPNELERRVRDRAVRSGQDIQSYLLKYLADSLPTDSPSPVGIGITGNEIDNADGPAPWRGVFELEPAHQVLFQHELVVRTADLPRWQPKVTFDARWVSDDE